MNKAIEKAAMFMLPVLLLVVMFAVSFIYHPGIAVSSHSSFIASVGFLVH